MMALVGVRDAHTVDLADETLDLPVRLGVAPVIFVDDRILGIIGTNSRLEIGRECVIKLADGRLFVKELRRGENGRFTLFGWNSPLIENVAVEWAAPVLARLNRNSR